MSQYNQYLVSGMTNMQIYTGTVSIQYRDTTTYRYTAHPYLAHMYVSLHLASVLYVHIFQMGWGEGRGVHRQIQTLIGRFMPH